MGPLLSILVGLSWFVLVTGGMLAWAAWRGRRVNDHPLCRKCGFDLVGHAAQLLAQTSQLDTVAKCPECGTPLGSPRAILVGQRVRRSRLLAVAIVMMILGGAGVGLTGWGSLSTVNWNLHKPTWLLVIEAQSPTRTGAQGVYAELLARQMINPSAYAGSRSNVLTAAILRIQGDQSAAWHEEMGRLLESMRASGQVDDARWETYGVQAIDTALVDVAEKIELDDVLPVSVTFTGGRGGGAGTQIVAINAMRVSVDGIVSEIIQRGMTLGGGSVITSLRAGHRFNLPPGEYQATVNIRRTIYDDGRNCTRKLIDAPPQNIVVPFQVVAKGLGVHSLRADPGLAAAIEAAITFRNVTITLSGPPDQARLEMQITVANSPTNLAMELLLDVPEFEGRPAHLHPILTVTAPAAPAATTGPSQHSYGVGVDLPDVYFTAQATGEKASLRFVLRSSLATLKSTVDMQSAWEGTIERIVDATIKRSVP